VIRFSSFVFELAVILTGFGIYEIVYGRISTGTEALAADSFTGVRIFIISTIIGSLVLSFLFLRIIAFIDTTVTGWPGYLLPGTFYILFAAYPLSWAYEQKGSRLLFIFVIALALAFLSMIASKIEVRLGPNGENL
jgi:hypothetical protein